MKRILRIILIVCIVCLCTAFASSCSEQKKVNEALENTRELENISVDVYMNVFATHGTLQKRIRAVENIVSSGNNAKITVGEYGEEERNVFIDEGYAYFDGYKQPRHIYESYNGSHTAFTRDLLDFEVDELLLEKAEISESAGKLKIKKTVGEEEERKLFNKMLKPFYQTIETRMNNLVRCGKCQNSFTRCNDCALCDVSYEGTSFEMILKDGYVEKIRVKFNMFATLDGLETTLNVDLEMNVNTPGEKVTVEFPQGYRGFADYDSIRKPEIEDWFK